MSETTKSCNLTETEIEILINHHGYRANDSDNYDERIERMNYLNKRRKSFREEVQPAATSNEGWKS